MQTAGLGGGAGRGSGAQVQLVTKSGSNARHGSLYEFYRTTGGRPAGRVDGEFKGALLGWRVGVLSREISTPVPVVGFISTHSDPRLPRRSSNTSPHAKPKRSGKKQGTSRIAEPRMAGRASRFILEKQLQRELDDARLRVGCAARGRNLTKSSAGERRIRITEQGQIRQIEHFRPELQLTTLINVGDLGNAHIDIGSRWPAERIPSKSAVRPLRRIVDRIEALSRRQYQIGS